MELGQSVDLPTAGQGAFAKVPIKNGTIFSLYGGMILKMEDINRSNKDLYDFEKKNKWFGKHPKYMSSFKYRQVIMNLDIVKISWSKLNNVI